MKEKGIGDAAVIAIVAIIVVVAAGIGLYVAMRSDEGPGYPAPTTIVGTALLSDNSITFTPTTGLNPDPMTESWDWCVIAPDYTVRVDWTTGVTTDMSVGTPITLSAAGAQSGDTLRIKCKGKSTDMPIVAAS